MRSLSLVSLLLLLTAQVTSAIQVDDSPAEMGTWGFRPLSESPAPLNPPGFTWRPVSAAKAYQLHILGDPSGQQVDYDSGPIPWSAHCPPNTLPTGTTLAWRYRAQDADGNWSDWSLTRTFSIAPDAVPFPQPARADLEQRMPKDHPRIFFRKETLPLLKEMAAGPLKERWDRLRKQSDDLLARPPDTSEPPLYPEGIDVKGEEWKKNWWGNRLHTIEVVDSAATLGFVYQLTGEEKYAKSARDLLMAFCGWDPQGSTEYEYNDEAAMPALYFPSRVYTWIHPILSKQDREKVIAVMRERGRQCFDHLRERKHLWDPYASHSNRAWHFLGELSLAFYDDIPEAPEWLDYVMTLFYTCYPVWGDTEGGWHEGVAYWYSYQTRFGYWMLTLDSAFGINVFDRPFYHQTGNFALYMVPPHTEHGAFADQAPSKNLPEGAGPLMNILASGARNPYWKWYADSVRADFPDTYYGFLWACKVIDLEPKPPVDLPTSTCFRGIGVASMNTTLLDGRDNVQMVFKSSPLGNVSHGFNSNNNFHLNVRGEPLLLNTGKRDIHGSLHHRKWMWESKSQNVILVNGEGQKPHRPDAVGRIVDFRTSPQIDVVVGEAGQSYHDLSRWTRAIIFLKPDYMVIHDVLEAPQPSSYDWLVHGNGQFNIDSKSTPPVAVREGERGRVSLDFLWPKNLSISQKDGYDPPPAEWTGWDLGEWHLSAKVENKSTSQTFVTVLRVGEASADYRFSTDETAGSHRLEFSGGSVVELGPQSLQVRKEEVDWRITIDPH